MGSTVEEKNHHLLQLPIIDFSTLDPNNPKTQEWQATIAKLAQALETHGCFEAIYDKISSQLRDELFGQAIKELFDLPIEVKMRNFSTQGKFLGYIGQFTQLPGMVYESLRIDAAATIEGVERFAGLLWPEGNPKFCTTAWTCAKHMQDLAQMVHRMVLQSFGLEKYYDHHIEPKSSGLRLSEYGVPLDPETKVAMAAHKDPNMLTIICQHQAEGLEVQTKDGEWIHVVPLPNSFTVLIGESFTAWTNGRFQAPPHQVKMIGDEKRYSALFGTKPSDDYMLQPLEELADCDHPLLFKPFNYKEYLNFRFSEEGRKYENTLEAYCGLGSELSA